jgi:hypothetical protein
MKFSDSDLSMWAREVVLVLRAAEVPVIDHAPLGAAAGADDGIDFVKMISRS